MSAIARARTAAGDAGSTDRLAKPDRMRSSALASRGFESVVRSADCMLLPYHTRRPEFIAAEHLLAQSQAATKPRHVGKLQTSQLEVSKLEWACRVARPSSHSRIGS